MKLLLLVEDNESDEKLAVRALRKSGLEHDIAIVRDGAEALRYLFAAVTVLPCVVLLDLQLPRIDGLDVLRQIRAHETTRFLPVVILTASTRREDIAAAYAAGANAFVRKSLDFAPFVEAMKAIGMFWLHVNEQPNY